MDLLRNLPSATARIRCLKERLGRVEFFLPRAVAKGLGEAGFIEGRNVAIDYRFTGNQPERRPGLAAELVRRRVRLIAAMGASTLTLSKASGRSGPQTGSRAAEFAVMHNTPRI
jgi:hypothetical protein